MQSVYWFGVIDQYLHFWFGRFVGQTTFLIFENVKTVPVLLW